MVVNDLLRVYGKQAPLVLLQKESRDQLQTVAEPHSYNQANETPERSRHSHRETFVSPNREVLAPVQPQVSGGGGGSCGARVVSIKMQTLAAI